MIDGLSTSKSPEQEPLSCREQKAHRKSGTLTGGLVFRTSSEVDWGRERNGRREIVGG